MTEGHHVASSLRTNLTREVAPLIGRESLLAKLADAFQQGATLITLTGLGGAGKTHLATWFAHASIARGFHEVWVCDLSAASSASDILHIVKTTLGLPNGASASQEEIANRLGIALGERGPLLLVLDNFEHLVDFASVTIGRWIALAAEASFLVTSRRRLGLEMERVIEVGPLTESDAIELFVRQARAIDNGLVIDAGTRAAIAEIVRRVDAMPLAIAMAVPWIQTLSAEHLAMELEKGLDLLTLDDPIAPARHARLDAVVRWSWDQLSRQEQAVLKQIVTLFQGRFSLATAEAVLIDEGSEVPLVAVLRNLFERSVLRTVRDDPRVGDVQFASFQTIVTFVKTYESPLDDETERRCSMRFLDLAEDEVRKLRSARLRSALSWLEQHRADLATLMARLDGREPRVVIGATLVLQRLAARIGPIERAAALAELALARARVAGDAVGQADGLRGRAEVAWIARQFQDAQRDLGEALALLAENPAPRLLGEVLLLMAHTARDVRDHSAAARHCEEALRAFTAVGDLNGQAMTLLVSATGPSMEAGDDRAREALERAAIIAARLEDALLVAHVDSALATWHANRGEGDRAIARHRSAVDSFTEAGDAAQRVRALGFLGVALFDAGEVSEGRRCIDQALDEARRLGMAVVAATLPDPGDADSEASLARMSALAKLVTASGDYVADGVNAGHVAALLLRRGELAAARRAYQLGLESMLANPERGRPAIHFKGLGAALDLAAGRFEDAEREFATALSWISGWEGLAGKAAGTLLELCIDLARRRVLPAASPDDRAVKQLVTMMDMASKLSPLVAMGVQSLRLALMARAESEGAQRRLYIGTDGRWFELDGEGRVDLARSGPIRSMLLALSMRAASREPLSVEDLFEAGWPGEQISPGSAANRVYATLARLRTLGLRDVVVRRHRGWMIDPEVLVELR